MRKQLYVRRRRDNRTVSLYLITAHLERFIAKSHGLPRSIQKKMINRYTFGVDIIETLFISFRR